MGKLTFEHGVWLTVQYLIIDRDQPTFAKEIIDMTGITREQAKKLQDKEYEQGRVIKALEEERTWKRKTNEKVKA